MRPWVVACISIILYDIGLVTAFPDGYILKVIPKCGNGTSDGTIEAISDLPIRATANCKNGLFIFPVVIDEAHTCIDVTFNDDNSATCLMTKREGAEVYTTTVLIGYGEKGSPLLTDEEQFTVTCTFQDNGEEGSRNRSAVAGLVAPIEKQYHNGPSATSVIRLDVTNVMGIPIISDIPAGKKIQLLATTNGQDGEVGLRASSCDVVGVDTNDRYAILRAGCGDGIVFKKNLGFNTIGNYSISPYFISFHLSRDTNVKFDCNFTTCSTMCDGSSCSTSRRRRHYEQKDLFKVQTHEYTIVNVIVEDDDVQNSRSSNAVTTAGLDSNSTLPWTFLMCVLIILAFFCLAALGLSLYSFYLLHYSATSL